MVTPPTVDTKKCVGCSACVAVCTKGVLEIGDDGKMRVAHPEKCEECDECTYVCGADAITRKAK